MFDAYIRKFAAGRIKLLKEWRDFEEGGEDKNEKVKTTQVNMLLIMGEGTVQII